MPFDAGLPLHPHGTIFWWSSKSSTNESIFSFLLSLNQHAIEYLQKEFDALRRSTSIVFASHNMTIYHFRNRELQKSPWFDLQFKLPTKQWANHQSLSREIKRTSCCCYVEYKNSVIKTFDMSCHCQCSGASTVQPEPTIMDRIIFK